MKVTREADREDDYIVLRGSHYVCLALTPDHPRIERAMIEWQDLKIDHWSGRLT